jgi:hypothetical protein
VAQHRLQPVERQRVGGVALHAIIVVTAQSALTMDSSVALATASGCGVGRVAREQARRAGDRRTSAAGKGSWPTKRRSERIASFRLSGA